MLEPTARPVPWSACRGPGELRDLMAARLRHGHAILGVVVTAAITSGPSAAATTPAAQAGHRTTAAARSVMDRIIVRNADRLDRAQLAQVGRTGKVHAQRPVVKPSVNSSSAPHPVTSALRVVRRAGDSRWPASTWSGEAKSDSVCAWAGPIPALAGDRAAYFISRRDGNPWNLPVFALGDLSSNVSSAKLPLILALPWLSIPIPSSPHRKGR